ncbi:MAG: phosphatidylserine decarboxylase family protein [Bacteroidales bacterium]|nr:phosphatidylserine decarboxylase family protein [Bacteroidales bacterium]
MKIHREGYPTILITFIILFVVNLLFIYLLNFGLIINIFFSTIALAFWFFFIMFFRYPDRTAKVVGNQIVSPADGEVVVIEKTIEEEYFKDERIQVSIFMSPLNVHVNWYPVSGIVKLFKYHPGKFLVAWHPKSSKLNERTTVVLKMDNGTEILVRQIAGAMARRIVTYSKENDKAEIGKEFGFIKFGSRLDVFLPIGTDIKVNLKQLVKGAETVIAEL